MRFPTSPHQQSQGLTEHPVFLCLCGVGPTQRNRGPSPRAGCVPTTTKWLSKPTIAEVRGAEPADHALLGHYPPRVRVHPPAAVNGDARSQRVDLP